MKNSLGHHNQLPLKYFLSVSSYVSSYGCGVQDNTLAILSVSVLWLNAHLI